MVRRIRKGVKYESRDGNHKTTPLNHAISAITGCVNEAFASGFDHNGAMETHFER